MNRTALILATFFLACASAHAQFWAINGSADIYNSNSGKDVGIGTNAPAYRLHVLNDSTTPLPGGAIQRAIFGHTSATTLITYGVMGRSDSSLLGSAGIYGLSTPLVGGGVGVLGASQSTSGIGVDGYASAGSGGTIGVRGRVNSPSGWAGYFLGRGYFSGNVGIRTTNASSPLTVNGVIESTTGGFKFPDGTTLTTANNGNGDITSVGAGDGLTGGGTSGAVTLSVNSTVLRSGGSAGGDLSGTFPNPTVVRLQGRTVSSSAPSSGEVLKWNGSSWTPGADDSGGGVTDHGQLSGLGDDDHPQYLLVTRNGYQDDYHGRLNHHRDPSNDFFSVFYLSNGSRLGYITERSGTRLHLVSDYDWLQLGSPDGVRCTNESGSQLRPCEASSFNVGSSARFKTDIAHLTAIDARRWLTTLTSLKPATYRLIDENDSPTAGMDARPRLGFIAEELPVDLIGPSGSAVDLYALTTSLAAALQALNSKVDDQTRTVLELQEEVAALRQQVDRNSLR